MSNHITFRVSKAEMEWLQKQASQNNLTVGALCKQAALGRYTAPVTQPVTQSVTQPCVTAPLHTVLHNTDQKVTTNFSGLDKIREDKRENSPQTMGAETPKNPSHGPLWSHWGKFYPRGETLFAEYREKRPKFTAKLETCLTHPQFKKVLDYWWRKTCPGAIDVDQRRVSDQNLDLIVRMATIFIKHDFSFPAFGPIATTPSTFKSLSWPQDLSRQKSTDAATDFVVSVSEQLEHPYDLAVDEQLRSACKSKFIQLAMKSDDWFKAGNKKNWSWLGDNSKEAKEAYRSKLEADFNAAMGKLDPGEWIKSKLQYNDIRAVEIGLCVYPIITLPAETDDE